MTQDEIIAMANAAAAQHGHTYEPEATDGTIEFLGSFADLVAAKEREACALVCESERVEYMEMSAKNNGRESDFAFGSVNSAERIAAAIRARGTKEGV